MSNKKHNSFCSSPMRGKPVTALPGIGAAYGDRLERAGYSSASDIYEKFQSFGFDSGKCQNWLNKTCGANSRYSSMCYEAIKGQTQTSSHRPLSPISSSSSSAHIHPLFQGTPPGPSLGWSPKSELSFLSPLPPLSRDDFYGNKQTVHQQVTQSTPPGPSLGCPPKSVSPLPLTSRDDSLGKKQTVHQQSPAIGKDTVITRAEVLEMMDQFQRNQDAMNLRIYELEQEKASNAFYVTHLETEIRRIDENTKKQLKEYDEKILELSRKLLFSRYDFLCIIFVTIFVYIVYHL